MHVLLQISFINSVVILTHSWRLGLRKNKPGCTVDRERSTFRLEAK